MRKNSTWATVSTPKPSRCAAWVGGGWWVGVGGANLCVPALLQDGEDDDDDDDDAERSEWQKRFETELEVLLAPFGKSNADIKAMDTDTVYDFHVMLEKNRAFGAAMVKDFYQEFCEQDPDTRTTKKQRIGWIIGTLRAWSAAPA